MSTVPHARAVDPSAVRESSDTGGSWWRHLSSWALGAAVGVVSMVQFDTVWPSVALMIGVGLVGAGFCYAWPRMRARR